MKCLVTARQEQTLAEPSWVPGPGTLQALRVRALPLVTGRKNALVVLAVFARKPVLLIQGWQVKSLEAETV